MVAVNRTKVEEILRSHLGLRTPQFKLKKEGGKLSGSVISSTFRGMKDLERQRRMWDALDAELGPESTRAVGTLLAYTPQEWDVDLEQ